MCPVETEGNFDTAVSNSGQIPPMSLPGTGRREKQTPRSRTGYREGLSAECDMHPGLKKINSNRKILIKKLTDGRLGLLLGA